MDTQDITIISTEYLSVPERDPEWKNRGYKLVWNSGWGNVRLALTENVIEQIHSQAITTDNEIGGILVGQVYTWKEQFFVEVCHVLADTIAESGPKHITFAAEAWMELKQQREQCYPEQIQVGWYHSHPNIEVFLSEDDVFMHQHFYSMSWHIALVINAQHRQIGFFLWDGMQIVPPTGIYWMKSRQFRQNHIELRETDNYIFWY